MNNYLEIIKKFSKAKILVIGDVMLDEYIWGRVNRISPEAPVQVVEVEKVTYIPGGAANVACNIASLSARAWVMGVTGDDLSKESLKSEMLSRKIDPILISENRPTIKKVRVIGQSQQLLRLDYEKKHPIKQATHVKILSYLKELLPELDCVVVSDYAKGMITQGLMDDLKTVTKNGGVKLIVDPKPRSMRFYESVDLITPNHKEASEFAGIEDETDEDLIKIGGILLDKLQANILITRGEKGMSLFEKTGKITHIPTRAKQVFDVTGAGDTVIAAVALSLASGAKLAEAAVVANYAAGVVVGKVGTASLTIDELNNAMQDKKCQSSV